MNYTYYNIPTRYAYIIHVINEVQNYRYQIIYCYIITKLVTTYNKIMYYTFFLIACL